MPLIENEELTKAIVSAINQSVLTTSETFGWLPPLLLVVSIVAASWLAYKTISENRALVKQRSTMEFIMDRSRDERFVKSFGVIRNIDHDNFLDIKFFAEKQNFEEQIRNENSGPAVDILKEKKRQHDKGVECLNYLLNQYEYMAVGIEQNIYDEQMLIDATRSSTVAAYRITEKFIKGIRENLSAPRPTAYRAFEGLAMRWSEID